MKTSKLLILFLVLFPFVFSSCLYLNVDLPNCIHGEGPVVERELTLDQFTRIDHNSSFEVIVSQGPVQKVVAVGNSNIIDHLNMNVHNKKWDITFDNTCFTSFDLKVYVTVPEIETIEVGGSGRLVLEDFNQEINPVISLSGSGDFRMNEFETANRLEVNMNSSGSFYADKKVSSFIELKVRVSGSGSFHGYAIEVEDCNASTSGSGSCYVTAEKTLDATISGSGSIHYQGSPEVNSEDYGSGSLRHSF